MLSLPERLLLVASGCFIHLASFGSTVRAAPVITANPAPLGGVTTDLFDVSQGGSVTASSPQNTLGGIPSDARSTFGFVSGFLEPANTIFADGAAVGSVDFIDFKTAAPIKLSSYELRLGVDVGASFNRSATSFLLYAGNTAGSLSLISSTTINPDYRATYGGGIATQILIRDTLNLENVQFFRLELTRGSTLGPRVLELDGFGTAVPEPSSIRLALMGLAIGNLVSIVPRLVRLSSTT